MISCLFDVCINDNMLILFLYFILFFTCSLIGEAIDRVFREKTEISSITFFKLISSNIFRYSNFPLSKLPDPNYLNAQSLVQIASKLFCLLRRGRGSTDRVDEARRCAFVAFTQPAIGGQLKHMWHVTRRVYDKRQSRRWDFVLFQSPEGMKKERLLAATEAHSRFESAQLSRDIPGPSQLASRPAGVSAAHRCRLLQPNQPHKANELF